MKVTTFGLDLAKRVFQLHWVDMDTGEICRRQLQRDEVMQFFAQREPAVVAMEACGSAHYWGRKLQGYGHEVRLIAAQFVRPFVKSNKTDAADAQAIREAAQRPGMRFVGPKAEAQQSVLMLHRMRHQLVQMRTMQVNEVRGLLYELGAELPEGRHRGIERTGSELERLESVLRVVVMESLREQVKRNAAFDREIGEIEKKLALWKKEDEAVRRLLSIPGVGLLSATAAVATMGDAKAFRSGREFAAERLPESDNALALLPPHPGSTPEHSRACLRGMGGGESRSGGKGLSGAAFESPHSPP
jgi:transposase